MTALRHTRHPLRLARLRRALWGLSSGLFCLGCGSDDDLAKGYLGDTPETGDTPPAPDPRAGVLELTDPWWCLGQPPPAFPALRPPDQPVAFVLPVLDWNTLTPLAGRGLTATLCPGTLFNCATPLTPPYSVREGLLGSVTLPPSAAGIPVIEGFDGFIKFEVSTPLNTPEALQFIPVSYFLGKPISGDVSVGQAVYMLQSDAWNILLQQSFPRLDLTLVQQRGTLIVGVFDCNGAPVDNARIEIVVAGGNTGMTPFLLPDSRIPIAQSEPLVTATSGRAGYLDVPPGAVQLRAFRGDDTEPFGSTEIGVAPGQMAVALLRPAFFPDADLSTAAPFRL
jgi:hypothetical protein